MLDMPLISLNRAFIGIQNSVRHFCIPVFCIPYQVNADLVRLECIRDFVDKIRIRKIIGMVNHGDNTQ